jgi:hypothetical protein
MIKKIFLLSVVVSQLTISCSKDDSATDPNDQNLGNQISDLTKLPYSSLKPEDQKVKMEAEANDMLVRLDKSKTSQVDETFENLGNLLDINTVDIYTAESNNDIEDILNVSGAYGIYTWNNAKQDWDKTKSTTELKFIFPAKSGQAANNAILSLKSTSSDIKVLVSDLDQIYLPTTVDATLTVDNTQVATIAVNSKYSNGKETPDSSSYKMTLSDGYAFEISGNRVPAEANSSFTFEGKNIIKFTSGSTANVDELLKEDALNKYLGTANGLITLMDNFVITVNTNIEGLANDEDALDISLVKPNWNSKTYYTDLNIYNKKSSEGEVLANNNNVKMILVSKKDGTKIADVIQKSVKADTWNSNSVWVNDANGGHWNWSNTTIGTVVQEYDEVFYLKFNDTTEVEMSAYFSTGFDSLNTKFQDFLKAFERN